MWLFPCICLPLKASLVFIIDHILVILTFCLNRSHSISLKSSLRGVWIELTNSFGLGSLRSVKDFGILSGVDLLNRKIIDEEVATNSFCFEEIQSKVEPFHSINFENA